MKTTPLLKTPYREVPVPLPSLKNKESHSFCMVSSGVSSFFLFFFSSTLAEALELRKALFKGWIKRKLTYLAPVIIKIDDILLHCKFYLVTEYSFTRWRVTSYIVGINHKSRGISNIYKYKGWKRKLPQYLKLVIIKKLNIS